jgi:alkylation response protein AidB-like acyl-CoA dehydrogenase
MRSEGAMEQHEGSSERERLLRAGEAELLSRARALRPLLERNAAQCERERRIADESLCALEDAGLLAVLVPERVGGQGASMVTQLEVAAELGRGCASTAWVQTLLNVTAWAASLLPPAAQREVFAGLRPSRVCGVLTASGEGVPVPGGYRVSGSWAFASGCLHASWATTGVLLPGEDPEKTEHGLVCMRLSELEIKDTWHVAGMRGTGSHTLIARDVFVPRHRALGGSAPHAAASDVPLPAAPSDRWPVISVLALVLLGPSLGMAEAILEAVRAGLGKSGVSYTRYARKADSGPLLHELGRAAMQIESARLLALRCAQKVDAAAHGGELDEIERAWLRGACGHAAELLRTATESLVSAAGASCFAESNPIQRFWRDLSVASRHAFLAASPSYETYGRALAGLPPVFQLL